jgi:aryl-alcohol dehydrogenase-like predicted oxidoreductase
VEASLTRLKVDYIDLYLCHFPDPDTPLEETLRTLDDLVRQGKIRYPGCSNFPAWQMCESLWISDRGSLAKFACNQVAYSLLDRRIEEELIPFCAHANVGITAYATTAIGLLSGRYGYGQAPPTGSPWALGPYNYRAIMTRAVDDVIRALAATARERQKSPAQVAMAWCLARPQVASVIVGADTTEHVAEDFGAVGWQLSAGEVNHLDTVSWGMRMSVSKDALQGYDPDQPWPENH